MRIHPQWFGIYGPAQLVNAQSLWGLFFFAIMMREFKLISSRYWKSKPHSWYLQYFSTTSLAGIVLFLLGSPIWNPVHANWMNHVYFSVELGKEKQKHVFFFKVVFVGRKWDANPVPPWRFFRSLIPRNFRRSSRVPPILRRLATSSSIRIA